MLLHLTMKHDASVCPAATNDRLEPLVKKIEGLDKTADEHGVTIHHFVIAAEEHVFFAIVEADRPADVVKVLKSLGVEQEVRTRPVMNPEQFVSLAGDLLKK